jgi:hypothetical protein
MKHKTKEIRKKKNPSAISYPQALQQKGQHLSTQRPEYQAPIPGLETKGITPKLLTSRLKLIIVVVFFLILIFPPF